MVLYRYMSKKELRMFLNGQTIIGRTNPKDPKSKWYGCHTESLGVCFFPYIIKGHTVPDFWNGMTSEYIENTIFEMYYNLAGIVSDEYLVKFSTNQKMRSGKAKYSAGAGDQIVTEYSIKSYSNKTFKLLKVFKVKEYNNFPEVKIFSLK